MIKNNVNKSNKTDLLLAIRSLLQNNIVGTQEEICDALEKKGFAINQVKVSRLLHKLGAIKMNEGEQVVYRLPTERIAVTAKDPLKQLVLQIAHNESLIVIQTAPGSAQAVARLLDLNKQHGVLGTVAGDDTIFVAPVKTKQIRAVFQQIYTLLLS